MLQTVSDFIFQFLLGKLDGAAATRIEADLAKFQFLLGKLDGNYVINSLKP